MVQLWAHAGISRRVRPARHAQVLGDLLDAHDNLHVDLSWVAFDQVVGNDEWLRVVARHPDRFVLGSDVFGDVEEQPARLARWTDLTRHLSAGSRRLVEHDNAARLWWPSGTA